MEPHDIGVVNKFQQWNIGSHKAPYMTPIGN